MKKTKVNLKQKALLMLCSVMTACAIFAGGGTLLAEKVNAQTVTNTYITFNEANAYDTSAKVVYYDADNSGSRNSEVLIYPNGRFNPMAKSDAVLWWTAPEAGNVTIEKKTITLNIELANIEKTDGVRYAVLKVDNTGKITSLTDDFWNELKCTTESGTKSKGTHYVATANYGGNLNVSVNKGEKIAIVINCGAASNNNFDQPIVTASMKFKPTEGTETTYAFETSFISAQVTALTNSETYTLGTETTNYYSWGASTFSEKGTITADKEKTEFTQTNVMDGKTENELVYKSGATGQWNIDGASSSYYVAVNGSVAKINAPTEFHDTQLVWKAPADGVFSLDSLTLEMAETKDGYESDGMKYAVLYKDSDGKYYDLYTSNQIDGDAPWHDLVWKEKQEITSIPDFAMAKDEEFIVTFNRKATNMLDPCKFDISIGFATESEMNTYEIKQGTSVISEQGVNNFYFRDAAYTKSVVYKQNNTTIKMDAYTDGYTLSNGAVVTVGANEQFVGWKLSNGGLYPAGGSYTYESTDNYLTFNAVIITLKTENSAGLRLSEDLSDAGIRFVTKFDLSALNAKDCTFGTIIAPEDTITDNDSFVKGGTLTVAEVVAKNYKTEGDEFTQNAVLKNLNEKNYNRNMKARGYVTVTYADKTTKTFYSNVSAGKSAAYVANELYSWFETTFKDSPNYEQLNSVITAYKNAYQA